MLEKSRGRHSSDIIEPMGKMRYESVYINRPFTYKDTENADPFGSKYKLGDYSKNSNFKSLDNSQYRAYNPEYNQQFYRMNGYNTSLNASIPRNSTDARLKEVLNQMNSPTKNTSFTYSACDRNRQYMSKDIDERISKIKQKYFEAPYVAYERNMFSKKRGDSDFSGRKINNYIGEELGRNRADQPSLRNSIYALYGASKAINFQYA